MEEKRPLQAIPDDELLHRLTELMGQSRRVEADVVAHIAEVDERRLYAREAFPSMFVYCMDVLHLSESEAYLRILAGRASRAHPVLLAMLADGRLHLTAIVKLAPHLTLANRDGLLERATYLSKRKVLALVAEIAPRPDVPTMVRKLPERRTLLTTGFHAPADPEHGDRPLPRVDRGAILELGPDAVAAPQEEARRDEAAISPNAGATHDRGVGPNPSAVPASPQASASPVASVVASPVSPAVIQPLSPGRYKVQFTASAEFCDKVERLRALMCFRGEDRDLAIVLEEAVTEKLERLEARRFGRAKIRRKGPAEPEAPIAPSQRIEPATDSSPSSRHIPAAVRRAVRDRDGDRCRYMDDRGRRCPEQRDLQFHHRHPFGLGGVHSVANVALICRAHNIFLAECDYGTKRMARHMRPRPGP